MKLFTLTLALERSSAATLRRWLSSVLADDHVAADAAAEIVLAAEEALNNAILHSAQVDGVITVTVSILNRDVYLTVSDRGEGFDSTSLDGAFAVGPESAEGLGLTLVRGLMSEVDLDSSDEGTTVRMVKRLPSVA
jgi:anti-sigma regulatory factor (Ser/Thr protein kinase)